MSIYLNRLCSDIILLIFSYIHKDVFSNVLNEIDSCVSDEIRECDTTVDHSVYVIHNCNGVWMLYDSTGHSNCVICSYVGSQYCDIDQCLNCCKMVPQQRNNTITQ